MVVYGQRHFGDRYKEEGQNGDMRLMLFLLVLFLLVATRLRARR